MPYDAEQRRLIALAKRLSGSDPALIRQALLEAMAVEANYKNVGYGDRDSEGVLQQRPSQGWGPASEDAATDINQFLARARAVFGKGFRGSAGQLAQAIQRSAFPERYDQRASEAARLLGSQLGSGGAGGAPATGGPLSSPGPPAPDNPRLSFARALIAQGRGGQTDVRALLPLLQAARNSGNVPESSGTIRSAPEAPGIPGSANVGGSLDDLLARFGLSDAVTSGHRPGAVTSRGTRSLHADDRARDLDPSDPDLQKLIAYVRANPGAVNEFFFDPLGWFVDEGRIRKGRIGGHSDHAHIAR